MKKVEIYDNGGETFDRFTVVIKGHIYGMSHNPLSPQGFNQYCGTQTELKYYKRNKIKLNIKDIPEELREAICQRLKQ